MPEREATRQEWEAAITEIRDRFAKFIKASVDRVLNEAEKEYLREEGQAIEALLASYAKKFGGVAGMPFVLGRFPAGQPS
jgi:hypothetical protein